MDGLSSLFKVMSGTSMSTLHITGVVALLKSAHPDWSPASINSAILKMMDSWENDGRLILDELHEDAP
jgi:subtilisin family serine protease